MDLCTRLVKYFKSLLSGIKDELDLAILICGHPTHCSELSSSLDSLKQGPFSGA